MSALMLRRRATSKRAITIKSTMNTNAKTNTKTSGMSEIRELTDDELDAVNGGAVDSFCRAGGDIGQYETGGVRRSKGGGIKRRGAGGLACCETAMSP
jgi:hypothetical protein